MLHLPNKLGQGYRGWAVREMQESVFGTGGRMQQRPDSPRRAWETVEYSDNPELPDIEDVKIVDKEFLPRPEELVFKELGSEKITLSLDKETVAFFKHKAKESGTSLQQLVRNLLREYLGRQNQ